VVIPGPIYAFLTECIAQAFSGRDTWPEPPREMALGTVTHLAGGGPFGWLLDARLDEVDGRFALEVLEDSRMSGPSHYRVWDDGTREALPTEATGYALPRDCTPEEKQRIEDEYYARNRAIDQQLRDRGFR